MAESSSDAHPNPSMPKPKPEPEPEPEPKQRPIVRLGAFLIFHSTLVSFICSTAGVLALFLLPILAKNTYISENSLMPGSANPMFSGHDTNQANRLIKDIMSLEPKSGESRMEIPRLLAQYMEETGAEVYHHKFLSQANQFHPLHFFCAISDSSMVQENTTCASHGISSVGIVRAPRGDGKEAIVLVSPYNSSQIKLSEATSLGLAYSIFSLLSQVNWLAKDIVWLAADSQYGEYTSVSAWLRDYHTPVFSGLKESDSGVCSKSNPIHKWNGNPTMKKKKTDVYRRAGTMAAALVFKVVEIQEVAEKDTLSIYAEASNGQMPNLDLINTVNYLAVHRQGFRVKVEKFYILLNSAWLKLVGEILESIGKVAQIVNPQWKFGIPTAEYIEATATVASSVYYQALGVPTGSHGAFRDYQVDAITLEFSPKVSLNNEGSRSEFLLRGGGLIEGVVRSVNNLLEKFHQSFFLYLLTAPSKFVSVGVYMIGFALLIAPLPVAAAALYSSATTLDSSTTTGSHDPISRVVNRGAFKSWRWLHAAKVVFVVHLWGITVSLLPSLIIQLPEKTPTSSMLAWVSLSIVSLLFLGSILGSPYSKSSSHSQNREWAVLKSVMIAIASIGLSLMSIINFATAQIGALLLVPMCLFAHPYKERPRNTRTLIVTTLSLVLALIGFPPFTLIMLKGWSEGFGNVSVGDFWNWAESLWAWNSATYLYLTLVHLPSWVLCIHVLLHPC